jgi:uncharacterized protein (TIGR02118 family)
VFKAIFTFRKRDDLSWEEFEHHARDRHGPLVAQLPGLRRYVQCLVSAESADRPFDGIAVVWYDDEEAYRQSFASDVGKSVIADAANYADPASETEVLVHDVARFDGSDASA